MPFALIATVASFTDAWIETPVREALPLSYSRIFYRCVDWNRFKNEGLRVERVASFTDAWIETCIHPHCRKQTLCRIFYRCVDWNVRPPKCQRVTSVASFTDAWIETYSGSDNESDNKSHLLQMRGLKPCGSCIICRKRKSHLLQMRGLKH